MSGRDDYATVEDARAWISECVWADLDPDEISDMPDDDVLRGVENHYAGGMAQFLRDGGVR